MKKVLAALLLATCGMALSYQSQTYTVAVDVDVVLMNAHVTDRDGDPVAGLDSSSFRIYEDRNAREISFFSGEDAPATIGLIVDTSNSMGPKWSNVRDAVSAFASDSNPRDEMFMLPFNDIVSVPLPRGKGFTSNAGDLEKIMAGLVPFGTTALYDAITAALKHSKQGKFEKKVFVVISDGEDNSSDQSLDPLLRSLQQANVTLYTVGIYDRDATDKNPKILKQLAAVTGGDAFFPKNKKETQEALKQIAIEVRSQYTLGFYPKADPDGHFHKVSVQAKLPSRSGLSVQTRRGYYARDKRNDPKR